MKEGALLEEGTQMGEGEADGPCCLGHIRTRLGEVPLLWVIFCWVGNGTVPDEYHPISPPRTKKSVPQNRQPCFHVHKFKSNLPTIPTPSFHPQIPLNFFLVTIYILCFVYSHQKFHHLACHMYVYPKKRSALLAKKM